MPGDLKSFEELRGLRENALGRSCGRPERRWSIVNLFDELVRECELDLALHCVCDYLLESETGNLDGPTNSKMSVQFIFQWDLSDDCVERLRRRIKMAAPKSARESLPD